MMKRSFRLLLICCLLLLPGCCLAAEFLPVAVTPASAEAEDMLQSVRLWQSSKSTYLFLPSGWNAFELKIWYEQGDQLTVNGTVTRSGEVVSCFVPGETVTVKYGKKTCKVKVLQSAGVASVHITTASGSTTLIHQSKKNRETGEVRILDAEGNLVCAQSLTQVRCRGSSAFLESPKKSYQIRLETKQDLFGMGESKTWILASGFRDRSFIRNRIALDMSSYAGLAYTPQLVFADAYINGEYCGLYYFGEKVEVSSSRVDIDDLNEATKAVNEEPLSSYPEAGTLKKAQYGESKWVSVPNDPEDISGGYLLRRESLEDNTYNTHAGVYVTSRGNQIQILSPKYATEKQTAYVSSLMQSVENAIYAEDGTDPETGKHYSELIDVPSFAMVYTLEESLQYYNANVDDNQYYYKPADSVSTLLFAGPVWDFDASLGSYANHKKPTAITSTAFWVNKMNTVKTWYPALYKHEEFQQAVREVWKSTFEPAMSILLGEAEDPSGILLSIDEYAAQVEAAAAMDYARWPTLSSKDYAGIAAARIGKTFEANISYLKKYVSSRRDWLNTQWQ